MPGRPTVPVAFVSLLLVGFFVRAIVWGAQSPASQAVPRPESRTQVEILKNSEAPDAYWCPMHPGVRSPTIGRCPLCSMDLVAIRPPANGEYRMDVAVLSGTERRGLGGLRLTLRDPANGKPVSDLLTVHEKPLHLFMVSRDLEYFAHVHPEASGDRFLLKHQAPPGEYVIIADFLPTSGTAQMVHRAIVAPGLNRPAAPTALPLPGPDIPNAAAGASGNTTGGSAEKTVEGVRIRLDGADLIAGQVGLLRFHLFNAADGTPIADLESYLGVAGHLLMTNSTLTESVHGHPEESGTHTPFITFKPMMPPPGLAKLWLQFQRHGKVITVSFLIDVGEP